MNQFPRKKQKAEPRSRLQCLHDRLVTMSVVETTAASQSGMGSWKTEPCRVLLRILSNPAQHAWVSQPVSTTSKGCSPDLSFEGLASRFGVDTHPDFSVSP
jgi:hypothetical protein